MTFLLAASLFFTGPAPMEMPRAQAFLVKERANRRERATMRLEDRFDKTESAMIRQDAIRKVRFLAMKMNRNRRKTGISFRIVCLFRNS